MILLFMNIEKSPVQTGLFLCMGRGMKDVSLKISDVGMNGDGIARLENGEVVFVPFSVPGDIVMAKVGKDHDGQNRAKITSILLKSPSRTEPPCRHFGVCGGCSLQHLNEEAYREFKKNQIIWALQKCGVQMPKVFEHIFISAGTRRRANFAAVVTKAKTTIGFHERRSSNIRDVPDCLLIDDDVRVVMEGFRPFLRAIAGEGAKMDILIQCVNGAREIALTGKIAPGWEAQQALADALRTLDLARISLRSRDYESYEILLEAKPFFASFDSLVVNLAPGAFLQPSEKGERALTKCVIDGAGDASCIVDLFCGNGTFTGPLMTNRKIIATDFAPDAIASLQKAGIDARLRNLFKEPFGVKELDGVDCVILDPPRAGAGAQVAQIANSKVNLVVYVSCNSQTFAKDASVLLGGDFVLEKLTLIDQFIWSPHSEIVGVFRRRAFNA
ncbi:MAG: hypothetical protein DI551_09550 [Micavibrio aeruginosavorus]|uniref:TRAM domain-containing protein n=1 Tax=Micavibrio aeruginosavorus TaxID=349221 RepID=A0A2W5MV81_9BACT|nr:MAG: hypothetical protein DI551_09550 [Micavibrio aeruginosavorus]